MRFWKRFRKSPNGQAILVATAVALLLLLVLPWPLVFGVAFQGEIIGIPTGYFLLAVAFPALMLVVTLWYVKLIAQVEPFAQDHEEGQ